MISLKKMLLFLLGAMDLAGAGSLDTFRTTCGVATVSGTSITQACTYGSSIEFYCAYDADYNFLTVKQSSIPLNQFDEIVLTNGSAILTIDGTTYTYSRTFTDASTGIVSIDMEDGMGQSFSITNARSYTLDTTTHPGILSIVVPYPYSLDLTTLAITNIYVKDDSKASLTGATDKAAFDYSSGAKKTITLQAEDGKHSQEYTVSVSKSIPSSVTTLSRFYLDVPEEKIFSDFYWASNTNSTDDYNYIDEANKIIHFTVPYEDKSTTDKSPVKLDGYKLTNGADATFWLGTTQIKQSETELDLNNPQIITVKSETGTTQDYTLELVDEKPQTEALLKFIEFCDQHDDCAQGIIESPENNQSDVVLPLSSDMDATSLNVEYWSYSDKASTTHTPKTDSDIRYERIDLSAGKSFSITVSSQASLADGGATNTYTIKAAPEVLQLEEFPLCGLVNSVELCFYGEITQATANSAGAIEIQVPYSTNVSRMKLDQTYPSTYSISLQVNEEYDFSKPREITISNGVTSRPYLVTVVKATEPNPYANLFSLTLCDKNNKCAALNNIDSNALDLAMPNGTDFSSIYIYNENYSSYAKVSYEPVPQTGLTFDLTGKVLKIHLIAEDNSTKNTYTIKLSERALRTEAKLQSVSICDENNKCANGEIATDSTVAVKMPYGSTLSELSIEFVTPSPGASLAFNPNPNSFSLANGQTFSISVTSEDGKTTHVYKIQATIDSSNAPLVAADLAMTTDEDLPIDLDILAYYSAKNLTVVARTVTDDLGTLVITDQGIATFTPKANANGSMTYTYTISNGSKTAEGKLLVTVKAVNDPVIALSDTLGERLVIDVDNFEPWTYTLSQIFSDVDNTIEYSCNVEPSGAVNISCENGVLSVTSLGGQISDATIAVAATDGLTSASATQALRFVAWVPVLIKAPVAHDDWRSALSHATHGVAILSDAKGRTLLRLQLPASESAVEQKVNTTAGIQWLRIGGQSWKMSPLQR